AGGVGGGGLEGGEQAPGVLAHAAHGPGGEQLGEALRHGPTVREHVADAAGGADVVLEHPEIAGTIAHQVDPGDVDAHPARRGVAAHRLDHVGGGGDQLGRDHPVGDRAAVLVDVL